MKCRKTSDSRMKPESVSKKLQVLAASGENRTTQMKKTLKPRINDKAYVPHLFFTRFFTYSLLILTKYLYTNAL